MINKPTSIFENIGSSFSIYKNNFVIESALPGYNTLSHSHVGSVIPYLARNILKGSVVWELGVGEVAVDENKVIVIRHTVVSSSDANNLIDFTKEQGTKQFYIFAHASNFNTGFNNVIVQDQDFVVDQVKCTYLVDTSCGLVHATLPDATVCPGLEIQFSNRSHNSNRLEIKDNQNFVVTLSGSADYASVVSDGHVWTQLHRSSSSPEVSALSSDMFSALADPAGNDGSLQYKSSATLLGSNLYFGASGLLLFGTGTLSSQAKTIIPSTGNHNTIINNTENASDFIVRGSGVSSAYPPKNLYFTHDGRLGLNLPSGTKPQTPLHIINSSCKEAIRIESISACPAHSPNITMYHKPSSAVAADTPIGKIVYSSKNSTNQKTNYVALGSIAKITTAGSIKGEFNVDIGSGDAIINTLKTNPDLTAIGYPSGNQLLISSEGARLYNSTGSGLVRVNSGTVSISGTSVGINGPVNINNGLTVSVSGVVSFPLVAKNQLLAINNLNVLAPATGFSLAGIGTNKILTTNSSGVVYGGLDISAFLTVNQDAVWSRYSAKTADICLRQITFVAPAPPEEFIVGDQIALVTGVSPNQNTLYRRITDVTLSSNLISSLLLDLPVATSGAVSAYSVSRGGYLLNRVFTNPDVVSDASANILSTRPLTDTIFNDKQKNINFTVFGSETEPALSVLASASLRPVNTGIYFDFATHIQTDQGLNIAPTVVSVNSNGVGAGAQANTANFGNLQLVSWSGHVTTVGSNGRKSFYGTYDQNGNVYEWVEDSSSLSTSTTQRVCGGSWKTNSVQGLRSVVPTPYDQATDDIGFRICSRPGLSNTTEQALVAIEVVPVTNLNNLSDTQSVLYTESYTNREGLNLSPVPITITNLGKTYQPYSISKYEITNTQYCLFLSAVARTSLYTTYTSNMNSNIAGGIIRSGSSGSYTYAAKANMGDKPVVFVDYLSAIRFTNWLHNGAPVYGNVTSATTESGAYEIEISAGTTTISKNIYQTHWLPSLNEWHKAAYFRPLPGTTSSINKAAVIVRKAMPMEISSGVLASLTVGDYLYADDLMVGSTVDTTGSMIKTLSASGTADILSGYSNYGLNIGPKNNLVIEGTGGWQGNYSSYISSKGVVLASTGEISLVSPQRVTMSGLTVDDIFVKNISYTDDAGEPLAGGLFPGPNGGFLYKNLLSDETASSDALKIIEIPLSGGGTGNFVALSGTTSNSVIYATSDGYLASSPYLKLNQTIEGLDGADHASLISTQSGVKPALVLDLIRIGPAIDSYEGSILTHGGTGPATWGPGDFLRSDGMTWNRNIKRAVEFIDYNSFKFSTLEAANAGTGAVTSETILAEFAIDETIAIYNQAREVAYAKIAKVVLIDSDQQAQDNFFIGDTMEVIICPPVSQTFFEGLDVETLDFGNLNIGYAFSIQKGAYLDMSIEKEATEGFDCAGLDDASDTRFKPSTTNTISIRPNIHTSFNKVAENIDFAIYGFQDTLYNRYEPSLFGTNINGIPTGLVPAFYVDVSKSNSVSGTIAGGVIREQELPVLVASGVFLDSSAKITINTTEPHVVSFISGIKQGYIRPDTTRLTGMLISGINDLSTYADLTVSGYTFSSGLITNDLTLRNNLRTYTPNAPLTINSLGQIISLIPPDPPVLPGAPYDVVASAGNGEVWLSWHSPDSDGNTAVNNYLIEYSITDGSSWVLYVKNNTVDHDEIISPTTNNQPILFRVRAVNNVGNGPYSAVSNSVTPSTNVPTAPISLGVTRAATTRTLAWLAPSLLGGSIDSYIIEYAQVQAYPIVQSWSTADNSGTPTALTITISGILEADTYDFRVRARNNLSNIGSPATVHSVGTDGEPPAPPEQKNAWDFGKIEFTGVCI